MPAPAHLCVSGELLLRGLLAAVVMHDEHVAMSKFFYAVLEG